MARKFAAVVFSLGCIHASSVMALGLGDLSLDSFLNEPLKATVDLLNTGGLHEDEIRIRLATKEDFDKLGLDRAYFLTSIKFVVDTDESGQTRILMTSEDPVLEPYLDFIIEARWPSGRLLREYTVLIDPPVFDQATPVISASQRVEEVEGLPDPTKKKGQKDSAGTRVGVRKSDLAPGEMPRRDYNAQASEMPAAGSRYMIRRDDTLWEIARQARPEGVSVHQTMLDIQRLNPEAFINGNINQVKAGYIVYLPNAADISSEDLAAALAQVRQQNEDWRQGRVSQPVASGGPSLRISAEPEPVSDAQTSAAGASAEAMEDLDKAALERVELEQRLVAMRQQVETLQRIVSVKDEQIAALQKTLGEAGESAAAETSAMVEQARAAEEAAAGEVVEETMPATAEVEQAQAPVPAEIVPAPAASKPAAKPQPEKARPAPPAAKPRPDADGGMMSYLLYILGAVLLGLIAVFFVRRRGAQSEQVESPLATEASLADVELQDEQLAEEAEAVEQEMEDQAPAEAEELAEADTGGSGYGGRKHDQYASDVDEVDALAEADIYIAYGRYPQAIDLLKNAIATEPGNPAYRLKLLELHADMGDRDAALQQFEELQRINDKGSLARAEALLAGIGAGAAQDAGSVSEVNPLDLIAETDEPLAASFSGLEIEDLPAAEGVAEDLDLSVDFVDTEMDQEALDEDLIIAAESNGFSTKLDLARAYLDMGDEDGARQILEEVAAEGNEELKSEAEELLERIG